MFELFDCRRYPSSCLGDGAVTCTTPTNEPQLFSAIPHNNDYQPAQPTDDEPVFSWSVNDTPSAFGDTGPGSAHGEDCQAGVRSLAAADCGAE